MGRFSDPYRRWKLAGAYPFKSLTLPDHFDTDAVASGTWNAETVVQSWATRDGDDLSLEFTPTIDNHHWYGFSLKSAPVITVSGKPRPADDWIRHYVRPIAEITTFATQQSQPVCWVTLHRRVKEIPLLRMADQIPLPEWSQRTLHLFAAAITQQPYDAAPTEPSRLLSYSDGTLIRLGPNGATLPDLLSGWLSLQATYTTFFDYLTVALRASMSAKSRFLALVPALEGFHVAKYGDGPMLRKDFRKRRADVLKRIRTLDGADPNDVSFVTEWLSYYGSYQLAHRLRVIADQELGQGLRERVRARGDSIPASVNGLGDQPEEVWAVMGTARNRIAHGDTNQPSRAHMAALTRLAHTVAVGAALNLLRVPDTVLCTAIDQGKWPVV